ncbi:putative toxin-antitoxin system toxin component, PIN family [Candidatus Woesebacteria bacterium]|nr:putative toxin-antitoxin system toxin component, PIN family [Candidatus Woesebacteria bacterium]
MIPRIVPDVNVFLSGTTISKHAPSQIIQAWRKDQVEIITSWPILVDLRKAAAYPKVQKFTHMSEPEIDNFVNLISESATLVPGTTSVSVSLDSDDNKLFSCALEASADYIVSMDKKHVLNVKEFQGIKTIHPTDFVRKVLKRRH